MEENRSGLGRIIARIIVISVFFVMLLFSGVILTLRFGVMKGKDIDDMLEHIEAYDYLEDGSREIVELYLDTCLSNGSELVRCVPQGMVKDSIKEMVGALSKEHEIDIYEVTGYKEEFAENIFTYTLDRIGEEVEKDGRITKDTIRRVRVIGEIDRNLNVELEKTLCNKVDKYQKMLDFRDSLPPELRKEIVSDISMVVNPAMDYFVNKYVQEVNQGINNEVDDTELRTVFGEINDYITISKICFVIVIVLTIITGFVVFLLYKDKRYSAFLHAGRCFAVIGALGFFIGIIGSLAKNRICSLLEDAMVQSMNRGIQSADKFAKNFIDILLKSAYTICSVYFVIGVVCIIIGFSGRIKKRK